MEPHWKSLTQMRLHDFFMAVIFFPRMSLYTSSWLDSWLCFRIVDYLRISAGSRISSETLSGAFAKCHRSNWCLPCKVSFVFLHSNASELYFRRVRILNIFALFQLLSKFNRIFCTLLLPVGLKRSLRKWMMWNCLKQQVILMLDLLITQCPQHQNLLKTMIMLWVLMAIHCAQTFPFPKTRVVVSWE